MAEQAIKTGTGTRQRVAHVDIVAPRVDRPAATAAEGARWRVERLAGVLAVAALLLAIGHYAATLAATRAAVADFWAINGDFQNFNPVKRMFLGQYPGQDFDSYLGLGPVWLLYLAMLPLGPDFTSSLMATQLLHAFAMVTAFVVLCRLCGLSWGWSCLLGWGALVYARNPAALPGIDFLHESLSGLAQPGTSCVGLRCLAPLLAAPGILWVLRRFGSNRAQDVRPAGLGLGTVGGALLPWSNDHGLAMAMALLLVGGVWLSWRAESRLRAIQAVAAMLLAMGLTAFVVVLLASGGNPWRWYSYNFLNVAQDQYWYFIGLKITAISDIPFDYGVPLAVVCLGWLTYKIRRPGARTEDVVLVFLILSNLLAGYVSVSGSIATHYFYALNRCLAVVLPYLALSAASHLMSTRLTAASRQSVGQYGGKLAAAAAGALLLFSTMGSKESHQQQQARSQAAAASLPVPELGGTLGHQFSKAIAIGREIRQRAEAEGVSEQRRLFSTYASAMDVVAGAVQAGRCDYIIHALGPQRRAAYLEQFTATRPRFVTTIRPEYTGWEYWLRCVNWDFYAHLLKHYRPTDRTFYNIVWEPRSEPAEWPDVPLETTITQGRESQVQLAIHFPAAAASVPQEPHLVEVEVEYDWQWKSDRLLHGALRPYLFLLDEAALWGLPPYESVRRFPIELSPGQTRLVSLNCQPFDSTTLTVRRCTARLLVPKSQIDGFPLSRVRASSLCDGNWTSGIWKTDSRAAFFVTDASDLKGLQPGSRLRFPASGERLVEQISGDQVWLQGGPLDPSGDGYPHAIEIVH